MACLLAFFHAKQLAEEGKDVVIIIESLVKLFKAYNNVVFPMTRINLHEVNLPSVADLKTLFTSARQLENGGSLSIVAYLNEPRTAMEEYIYSEFADLANIILPIENK
jgi:transcription termination factor Rho